MARNSNQLSICVITCIIAGSVGASAQAQNGSVDKYYYRYFDQRISLECDMNEVAVFVQPSAAAVDLSLVPGIESIESSDLPTLVRANTSSSYRNPDGVQSVVSALSGVAGVTFVSPVFRDSQGDSVVMSRYIHVGFEAGVDPNVAQNTLMGAANGVIEAQNWSNMPGVYRVRYNVSDGFATLNLANRIAAMKGVRFSEPDLLMKAHKSLIPNDTYWSLLWGLHNIGQSGGTPDMDMDAPEAWDITTGDPNVIVAILDDGTQQDHPDINQIPGADFTGSGTGGGPFNQCDNHGTAVAGCTSAIINNGLGVVGAAPNCRVGAAKWNVADVATPCPGTGSFFISWFVNALDWAQTTGAKVTNNSNSFGVSSSITNKYQTTRDAGLVHFAASGNSGAGVIGYPASLPTVNAVGAVDRNGNRASFSQYGTGLAFVAPGVTIATTDRTGSAGYVSGDYVSTNGTSFSSPYAAAVAALVFSVDDSLLPDDVEQIINSTAMDRGASGYDTQYGWGFVNLFGAVQAALPTTLALSGSCYFDAGMTQPVDPLTVQVTNLNTGATFQAGTAANQYTLDLNIGSDVHAGDTLRYIAKDDTQYINVTDHQVAQADVIAGSLSLDLVLDEFYLDLTDFPQYEADGPSYNDFTGAAVAQMVLNYIWWDSTQDPTPPLTYPDQSVLYSYGLSHNATGGLTVFDPAGMHATIQDNRPLPYSQFGYNFSIRQDTDSTEILKQIAQWIAYEIGTYGGLEPGHAEHVPGVIPAYGGYSNWMAVRGIHTSEDAYPLPAQLDVFGFWINDPLPAAFGGIGENSYKTADELLATYYLPLATGDSFDGKYVAICEPPDEVTDKDLTLMASPVRFNAEASATVNLYRVFKDNAPADLVTAANGWVIQAAIDGVTEQLIPYDSAFARSFSGTTAAAPLMVSNESGDDYFAVPFHTTGLAGGTVAVVLVDAEDGAFKEASWVSTPVVYPPVSEKQARSIAGGLLEKYGIEPVGGIESAVAELVHFGSTPYHPTWRVKGRNYTVLVDQNGSAQLE